MRSRLSRLAAVARRLTPGTASTAGDQSPAAPPLARRRRALAGVLTVALLSAVAGWYAGRGIRSPDEVARDTAAPPASAVTVPVERRTLSTAVVTRGDVEFAQAMEISVEPEVGDGTLGALVVSGRVPRAGQTLAEGAVAIEVSGRPVFLLTGALPMYRTLRLGMAGNEVRQLEQALRRLRLFSPTPDTRYDAATAAAVTKLYRNAGYQPVGPSPQETQQIVAAETQLVGARATLRDAEAALAEASRPARRSEVLAAESAVDQARATRDQAVAELRAARASGADPTTLGALEASVRAAESQVAVAQAQLAELKAPPDTAVQRRAVTEARGQVAAARRAVIDSQTALAVRLPRGEVVFVPSLPRRVQQVQAKAGAPPGGPAFSLTASALQIDSSVSLEERKLVKVGASAQLDDQASGVRLTGTVTGVADEPGTDGAPPGSFHLRIAPSGGQPARLAGMNLRITIPIESTDGDVLAVPLAALVTDAAGAVHVRVARGAGPFDAESTVDVPVTVGLAAEGFAEVTPIGGDLDEGDLVVVGVER